METPGIGVGGWIPGYRSFYGEKYLVAVRRIPARWGGAPEPGEQAVFSGERDLGTAVRRHDCGLPLISHVL